MLFILEDEVYVEALKNPDSLEFKALASKVRSSVSVQKYYFGDMFLSVVTFYNNIWELQITAAFFVGKQRP